MFFDHKNHFELLRKKIHPAFNLKFMTFDLFLEKLNDYKN